MIQLNIKRQLRYLYAYEAVICFRITDVVWVLFLLNRGYSLVEVGIAEGMFHLTSMICEVPSGMVSDLFGRKKTLVMAGILGGISSLFMGFGDRQIYIYLGMMFSALAITMMSGTEEAILYDSLLEAGEESAYKEKQVNMSIIGRVLSTASYLFSPIAIALGYRKTYLVSAFLNLIQFGIALKMKEPIITECQRERMENPFGQIKKRFLLHINETFSFIKHNPRVMCKLLADAVIGCPCYLTLMYLQEHLVDCGWPEGQIGIPMLVIPIAGTVGTWIASKVNVKLFWAVLICGIGGGIGVMFAGSSVIFSAIAGAMFGRMCEGYITIAVSSDVNKAFSSDQRATLISVDCMLYSVLMIIASPVTGYLGEQLGMKMMFIVFGISILTVTILGCFFYGIWNRKQRSVRESERGSEGVSH